MTPAAEWADEATRREHNARIEADGVARRLARVERSVALLRAALTVERERGREVETQLRGLLGLLASAEDRGMALSPSFTAMHVRAALRALGSSSDTQADAPDATDPADRLYRVNDDPDTDTTIGALIEANEGAPLPAHDMARLRALATGERLTVAIPHGPRLTFERRA